MRTRRPVLAIFAAAACLCWGSAQLLKSQDAVPVADADGSHAPPAADAEAALQVEHDLDLRYATARLKLVQATLARYQDTNRRVPNSVRRSVIESMEGAVQEAEQRVAHTQIEDPHYSEIYISVAQSELQRAERQLSTAKAANAKNRAAVDALEVARLAAEVELAKVRLEKAKHLASESPLSNVRYELGQLREMVQELRLAVALLRTTN